MLICTRGDLFQSLLSQGISLLEKGSRAVLGRLGRQGFQSLLSQGISLLNEYAFGGME